MATLYKVDGSVQQVHPAKGKSFSYKELQGFVGELIQIVPMPNDESVVCHDEGKLIGLLPNPVATAIWKKAYPIEQYPFNNDELLVGDILIASEEELEGEEDE